MAAFNAAFPTAKKLGRPLEGASAAAVAAGGVAGNDGNGGFPTLLAEGLGPDEARVQEETWGAAMQVGGAGVGVINAGGVCGSGGAAVQVGEVDVGMREGGNMRQTRARRRVNSRHSTDGWA